MPLLLQALTCLALLASVFVSACSNDSDPPANQGGNGGATGGSSSQAGASSQAGKTGGGGSSSTAGSSNAGSSSGGDGSGGSAGNAGGAAGGDAAAGAPNGDAGSDSGGAPDEGSLVSDCLDAPVIDEVKTEALHFQGAGLELGIVRRADPDSIGTSGTTPWLPERFALVRGAVAECVSTLAALDYVASHHNFDDQMTATAAGETWVFQQMRVDYDQPTLWTVQARNGNTALWGPVTLTLLSCERLDMPGSCAEFYQ
jgi:hypothetical protein